MFNTVLADLKAKLATIQGIKTCKVGIESNLAPADYPIIRLQPNQFRKSDRAAHYRICDLYIYFGLPLTEGKDGLETIYTDLLEVEQQIIDMTQQGDDYRSTYIKTLTSDSSVEHYKLMCIVLEVEFVNG